MSKVVQDSSFWQLLPGKVAEMIEQQARQHALQCKTRLQDQAEENEHSLVRWYCVRTSSGSGQGGPPQACAFLIFLPTLPVSRI